MFPGSHRADLTEPQNSIFPWRKTDPAVLQHYGAHHPNFPLGISHARLLHGHEVETATEVK